MWTIAQMREIEMVYIYMYHNEMVNVKPYTANMRF